MVHLQYLSISDVLAAKSSDPTQSKKDVSYLTCIMENLLKPMKGIEVNQQPEKKCTKINHPFVLFFKTGLFACSTQF